MKDGFLSRYWRSRDKIPRRLAYGTLDWAPSAVHATNFPQLVIHLPQLVIPMSHRTHIHCFSARQDNFYVIRLTIIHLGLTFKNRRDFFVCRHIPRKWITAAKRSPWIQNSWHKARTVIWRHYQNRFKCMFNPHCSSQFFWNWHTVV